MDRILGRTYTVPHFMVAMVVAIASMGTNVYQICRRELGTLELEPWLQKSALSDVASAVTSWFTRLRRSPFLPMAATVALALLINHLSAGHALGQVLGAAVIIGTDPKELREQINKLGTDMSAIVAKAGEEKRELTPDEETRFDGMDADREKLIAAERRILTVANLEASAGRRSQPTQPSSENRGGQPAGERKILSVAEGVRSWLLSARAVPLTDTQRDNAKRLGIDTAAKHMTIRLADRGLTSFRNVDEWEKRALSTLNSGSPVDGYYTVQNEMMRPIEEALLAFGGMRRFSTVLRTETGAALPIPTDNDTSNEGEIIAQNSAVNEQDTHFNQLVLDSFKYSSKMIRVSLEFLQDSTLNVSDYLGRKLGTRLGRILNRHFTVGTGNSQPLGIVAAATASGVQLAAATPTYAEMVQIQHSVDPAYRESPACAWMFHDSMLSAIKQIVDASTGRPIWLPNMVGGEPDTILGDPYVVNQNVAVSAASGAAKSIVFGDLSKYIIRDVKDITLVRLDERYAEYGQVAFLAWSRNDGDLLDAGTHPVKYALNKA